MDAGDGTEAPAEDTEEAQKRRKGKERNKRRKLVIYDDRVYMTKKSQKGEWQILVTSSRERGDLQLNFQRDCQMMQMKMPSVII